jgi:hypothetical protein
MAGTTPILGLTVELALPRKDRVDPLQAFDSERRLALLRELEEFAPGMALMPSSA